MILGVVLTVMTLAAAALVVVPLLTGRRSAASRAAHELEIYRDQLDEVERDLARGLISETDADGAKAEIGRRMLAATDGVDADELGADTAAPKPRRMTAIVTGIAVPALAALVYVTYGSPDLPGKPAAEVRAAAGPDGRPAAPRGNAEQRIEISRLAGMLEKNPDDLQSWIALGTVLSQVKRHRQAAVAYTQAMRLAPGNADVASRAGEALTFAAGGQVTPEAEKLFSEAVRRSPGEPRAQFYLGLADQQGGRLRQALERWVALESASPKDAPWLQFLRPRIARIAGELGIDSNALAAMRGRPPSPAAVGPGPTREQIEAARNMSAEDRQTMIRNMVDGLATRLKDNPDDVGGWLRLGRARGVLGEHDAAKQAFAKAAALRPDDVEILVAHADSIVAAADPSPPPAAELKPVVDRILARDPNEPRALWLSGALALSAGDAKTARTRWTRLLEFVDPNGVQYVELKRQLEALKDR